MRVIYRVEHKTKKLGPYSCGGESSNWLFYNSDYTRHPGPVRCGFPSPYPHQYFGFSSKKLLKKWFGSEIRKIMHSEGFHVIKLIGKYDHRCQTTGQVMYRGQNVTKVENISLTEV